MNSVAESKVALITGGARRVGAAIARHLHSQGFTVFIHYRKSKHDAEILAAALNNTRKESAHLLRADLSKPEQINDLISQLKSKTYRLDALINNASSFYPTPIGSATEEQWDDLFSSNAKAPFFLCQGLSNTLKASQGCIVNIADIHAERPLKEHTLYCMAKAANVMLTKSLARELAPEVRVNGIAPGAILWPEQEAQLSSEAQQDILSKIPLKRSGTPMNIASTVAFLLAEDSYVTGQIISIDGGRSLNH